MSSSSSLPSCRDLGRFLWIHNPFYLFSAGLVLCGLHLAFGNDLAGHPGLAWGLAGSLAGYTLLLALTGFLIVRLGIWEDARSIILLVVLMLVAVSMGFDPLCNTDLQTSMGVLGAGLAFAVAVSEALIRGLRIRFPVAYRLPYHTILGLFFMHPLLCSSLVTGLPFEVLEWRVWLFPQFAAVLALGLIPAIRQGSQAVRKNGTPWQWPWFPWTVFGVLAFGIGVRCYVLSLSFLPAAGWESIFAPYFLTPSCLVVLILLMEIGLVERRSGLVHAVLYATPGLLLLAIPTGGALSDHFRGYYTTTLGSPIWQTLWAVVGLYALAWLRGVVAAERGLVLGLIATTFVDSRGLLGDPNVWPMLLLAAIQISVAVRKGSSARCLIATGAGLGTLAIGLRETWFMAYGGFLPLHLGLLALLAVGLVFSDEFARGVEALSRVLWVVFAAWAVIAAVRDLVPLWIACGYGTTLASIALALAWNRRSRKWLKVAGADLLLSALATSWSSAIHMQQRVGAGALATLAGGLTCLVIGVLISSHKADVYRRLRLFLFGHQFLGPTLRRVLGDEAR